jgi:DNA invertase Pin-like site-specific DNA recombinase
MVMATKDTDKLNTSTNNDFCAYIRVSRKHQDYNAQLANIQRFAEYRGFNIVKVYEEKVSTKKTRPEYARMLAALRNFEYAGVICWRLDRLGRTATELILNVEELESKGIRVISVNESFDTSTAIGQAMRRILAILAELEREHNAEASAQRRESAKAAGKHIGRRPAASLRQISKVRKLRQQGVGLQAIKRQTQLSYGTVWAIINNEGIYANKLKIGHRKLSTSQRS